ncbi:hypothetical protein FOMPIDRAFT_1053303 [Fomitopsis schrenkii]|uniref:CFEM domain-containing protein n=1 Tax=Fomitopsis schrenkii TaxID=2126942 RepID=S8DYY7_FOMSC|nr:hypothetical protein FOMPIDRAFT_1053303 [Fomitopsis schrenkii]
MHFVSALVLVLAASLRPSGTSANVWKRQIPGVDVPPCAAQCLTAASMSPMVCSAGNEQCLCSSPAYVGSVESCIEGSCTLSDVNAALQAVEELCTQAGVSVTLVSLVMPMSIATTIDGRTYTPLPPTAGSGGLPDSALTSLTGGNSITDTLTMVMPSGTSTLITTEAGDSSDAAPPAGTASMSTLSTSRQSSESTTGSGSRSGTEGSSHASSTTSAPATSSTNSGTFRSRGVDRLAVGFAAVGAGMLLLSQV